MIKVYSVEWCGPCNKVKKYLESKNVSYEAVMVADDKEERNIVQEISGQRGVPVTTINNHVIIGFDKEKIDAALAELNN